MATVPLTAEYAAQIGKVQMEVPMAPTIPTPTAVQSAVPIVDTDRYPRDFAVSGSKQSSGITALMSLDFGKSSGFNERAFRKIEACENYYLVSENY